MHLMKSSLHFICTLGVFAVSAALAAAESQAKPEQNRISGEKKIVVEPSRETPISHEADVVVIGAAEGGIGGIMAAVAAARRGAKTILIEQGGCIDPALPIGLLVIGTGEAGGLPSMREGLYRDLVKYVISAGESDFQPMTLEQILERETMIVRRQDVVTTAMLQMMKDAGVQMLFHTRFVSAVMESGRLTGIIVESPQGRHAIRGKVFVDSTGLGDVAAAAGAPMHREEPDMGLQSILAKVDPAKYEQWAMDNKPPLEATYRQWLEGIVGPFEKLEHPWNQWWPEMLGDRYSPAMVRKMKEASDNGELTLIRRRGARAVMAIPEGLKLLDDYARPRTYITGIDPLNLDDLNWAEVNSRLALMEFQRFLKKYVPGFEQCVMERMDDSIALRGGRYIKVAHNITEREVTRGARHPDAIFLFRKKPARQTYEMPYRALLPDQVEGLLVVGKASAGGAYLRTTHCTIFQGQAAGTAAALAVKEGLTPRKVDIARLQAALKADGVEIPYPATAKPPAAESR